MNTWKDKLPPMGTLGPFLALLAACAFFATQSDRFLSGGNFSLILQQVMVVGVIAIGQTLIILTAGTLIGKYAKGAEGGKPVRIAMLDLNPGITVGVLRHNGFLQGFGIKEGDPRISCTQYTAGDQAKGQTAMENCLQKNPDINLVYTINEPAAAGAFNALKKAGKDKGVTIVSVDGGCQGVKDVGAGAIAATSQQYPLKMASMGVAAGVEYAKSGKKPSGYTDTGVTLIANKPVAGVDSKDVKTGTDLCWGKK